MIVPSDIGSNAVTCVLLALRDGSGKMAKDEDELLSWAKQYAAGFKVAARPSLSELEHAWLLVRNFVSTDTG